MYIGISGYNHESAVALVDEHGTLVDYYREEFLSRVKGDKSFPKRSLKRIIQLHNIEINQIKSIAFYERPLSSFLTSIRTAALNMPRSLPLISHQCRNFDKSSISCYLDLSRLFPGLEKKLLYLDHHLSHTLTALAYSDIQSDICSIVVDGFGDRSTTSIAKVNNLYDIKELWCCDYPSSLGLFYSSITDFLGFEVNEGEYKVMGLSSFGNSNSLNAKNVFNLIKWNNQFKTITMDMSYFDYHISPTQSYSNKLVELLGPPRNPFVPLVREDNDFQYYADIAKGAQDAIVNILCQLFNYAHTLTGSRRFLFSGGVAMNSASLDEISSLSCVDKIIIPPSPGDAGASIGSAYFAYLKNNHRQNTKLSRPTFFPSNYDSTSQQHLAKQILTDNFITLTTEFVEIISISAKLISKGEVIGISINNAETGPRALGNRSLVCDGTNKDAVNTLNTLIKNRSPFRPTAPSMKYHTANKYYVLRNELIECYKTMSATCKCRMDTESINFPTTHIDHTARLQIVEDGQILFSLLDKLEDYNIQILANSSFNLSGDPTSFDLFDALMVSMRKPLKYIITNVGLLQSIL